MMGLLHSTLNFGRSSSADQKQYSRVTIVITT